MSATFSRRMLPDEVDAVDTLYVTNRDLDVVFSNEGWDRFASENNGQELLEPGWRGNVLASFRGRQRDRWEQIYRLLLAGRLPHHQEQVNCSSPAERRIYQMRITPVRDDTGEIVWLVHHNVRIDDESHVMSRVERQLRQVEDRTRLREEFSRRIVERHIRVPGFAVARHFEPLEEIGGDLLWHREYPDGVCDLIHADVMGHGEDAGRLAARMAILLDELASVDLSPRRTVAALNRALLRVSPEDEIVFATGLCFRFEPALERVTCCNFGHEGPIFSRTGPIEVPGGRPVGLDDDDERWIDVPIELGEHGTAFLVFSDGITEQFNADGAMFGIDRLHAAFRAHLDAPVRERVRRIVDELHRWRGTALVKDDQTLLALDFVGGEGEGPSTRP